MKSDINAAKSYDGITDYDISTLIENIQRIMKERNITQEELAAAAGIAQPRISKIFKREGSNCFTIQQLVAIASYFHVSVDSLLGIKTNNPPEEEKEITLSDVCVKLFELDDLASISFGECRNGEIIPSQTAPGEWEEAYGPWIYFKNDSISNFISEWIEMKEINVKNKALKTNLYTTWKNGSIVENKDKYKSTKFQDIHSYQIELAKEVIAGNGAPFNFIPFTKKERELFEKYMDSGSYILDFFDSNEQHILEEYLSLSKTQA